MNKHRSVTKALFAIALCLLLFVLSACHPPVEPQPYTASPTEAPTPYAAPTEEPVPEPTAEPTEEPGGDVKTGDITFDDDGLFQLLSLDDKASAWMPLPEGFTVDDFSSPYCLYAMSGTGDETITITYSIDDTEVLAAYNGDMDAYVADFLSLYAESDMTQYQSETQDKTFSVSGHDVHVRSLVYIFIDGDQVFRSICTVYYFWWQLDDTHVLSAVCEYPSYDDQFEFPSEETLTQMIFDASHT